MDNMQSMLADKAACYEVFRAHDPRFDGKLFVGVSSTHIYCRPVCRVKMPKIENCTYFPSAAAAEAAGYRPCLRCRPELAPGLAPVDAGVRSAQRAAHIIENELLADSCVRELAEQLDISDRHLRRIFGMEYGVSPVQYLQTRRLLLAKSLLTETQLPVTTVAMSSGFGSVRRFNDSFKKQYRLSPSRLRKEVKPTGKEQPGIGLMVGYRPPFAWDFILSELSTRLIPGVENIEKGVYRRTLCIVEGDRPHRGWISVSNNPGKNILLVTLSEDLLPVLPKVLAKVRQVFDLDSSPADICGKLHTLNGYCPDICVPGVRIVGSFDPLEAGIRLLLARELPPAEVPVAMQAFARMFGSKAVTPYATLDAFFPTLDQLDLLARDPQGILAELPISSCLKQDIANWVQVLKSGQLTLDNTGDPLAEIEKLQSALDCDRACAEHMAMLTMSWPDALFCTPSELEHLFGNLDEDARQELLQSWRPWLSYVSALVRAHAKS